MWIVQLALRRPYTFVVMSMLIVILGVLAIVRMPTDIFPEIDIPVVSVIWTYGGVSPEEMAEVITIRSRARLHHHGERHRAHGIAVAPRPRRHQASSFIPTPEIDAAVAQLAAGIAVRAAHHCPRDHAAQRHPLQRLQRPHPAARHFQRHADRAGSSTISATTSSAPRSRTCRARASRCPTAASRARSSVDLDPQALYAQGLSRHGRGERDQLPEPDPAVGHRSRSAPRSTPSS